MNYEVDTQEVRRVAKQIREIAGSVKQLSSSNVRRMKDSVQENMRGETADALHEVLSELSSDILKVGNSLDAIQRELMEYVKRVEEADRQSKEIING